MSGGSDHGPAGQFWLLESAFSFPTRILSSFVIFQQWALEQ